ncbi:MAG TPA: 4'-phosphopantetheinyl transferase superfamily protein [Coxiellaceae bacterium]|nr:4'-phosphopantetheinyl transferase superfamily protein [Coxiellaceae bacterium]
MIKSKLTQEYVDIWLVSLDDVDSDQSILSANELSRAARFVQLEVQNRFIKTRVALRQILSKYLVLPPKMITFDQTDKGKPFIKTTSSLQFNLSHSGDYALIGVSAQNPVGVDIEKVREKPDLLAIAKRFFSICEYQAIKKLPIDRQTAAFYRCWTRKEAFIKAIGAGLSFPLSDFEVDITENPGARTLLLDVKQKSQSSADWDLQAVTGLPVGYEGALCVRSQTKQIQRLKCL